MENGLGCAGQLSFRVARSSSIESIRVVIILLWTVIRGAPDGIVSTTSELAIWTYNAPRFRGQEGNSAYRSHPHEQHETLRFDRGGNLLARYGDRACPNKKG